MAPPASWDAAALGWYSQKRTFKRKYLCVRPKYAAPKLDGIKRTIHRLTMQQVQPNRPSRFACPVFDTPDTHSACPFPP